MFPSFNEIPSLFSMCLVRSKSRDQRNESQIQKNAKLGGILPRPRSQGEILQAKPSCGTSDK
jgi:hypothetical protein